MLAFMTISQYGNTSCQNTYLPVNTRFYLTGTLLAVVRLCTKSMPVKCHALSIDTKLEKTCKRQVAKKRIAGELLMINSTLFIKKLALMSVGVALMMVLVNSAKADDSVTRQHEFDLQNFSEVEFTNSVGRLEIVPTDGREMRITLDIESDRGGFFRRRVDVDDMDLEVRERGDTLILVFDEKHVNAQWYVEMPAVDKTTIEMGVGELRLEIAATELNVELGVGDVDIDADENNVGRVDLDVGVGDARIRGGDLVDSKSAFISKRMHAEGKGQHDIEVDVGVGDVSVRLN